MAAVITLTLGFVFNWRSHIGKRSLSKHDGFTFIKMELIRLCEPICLIQINAMMKLIRSGDPRLVDLSYINVEGTFEDYPIRFGGPELHKRGRYF